MKKARICSRSTNNLIFARDLKERSSHTCAYSHSFFFYQAAEAAMALTGRFDFRKTLMGKVILLVEEEVPAFWSRSGERPVKKRWRNATLMDLTTPEVRALMDLRFKPQYMAHHVDVDRTSTSPHSNVVPLSTPNADDPMPASQTGNSAPTRLRH